MKSVKFRESDSHAVIKTQSRILDALLAESVPVKMLCGGRGLCATCHVYIKKGADQLTPQTKQEKLTLAVLTGATSQSRLACQARVIGDGVELSLPKGLYIESVSDLENLVGKRAGEPLLHPITGAILVPQGKIIMRTVLKRMESFEFDLTEIKAK